MAEFDFKRATEASTRVSNIPLAFLQGVIFSICALPASEQRIVRLSGTKSRFRLAGKSPLHDVFC